MWSDLPADVELYERKVKVGKNDIYLVETRVRGRRGGADVLLLLPGTLGSSFLEFKPQLYRLPHLLPNHRIICWDPPGFGLSTPPPRHLHPNMFQSDAQIIHELMKLLRINKFSLLGTSGGGITALIYASTYPKYVDKLIVMAANSFMMFSELQTYENMKELSSWRESARKPFEDFYGSKMAADLWREFVKTLWEIYRLRDGDWCRDGLKTIEAQTLVILGEKDVMIDLKHAEIFRKSIKNCQVEIFKGGSHKMHLKFSEEVCKMVREFLAVEMKAKI